MEPMQPDLITQPPPPLPADDAAMTRLRRKARRLRWKLRAKVIASSLWFPLFYIFYLHEYSFLKFIGLTVLFAFIGSALEGMIGAGKWKEQWRETINEMTAHVGLQSIGSVIESIFNSELQIEARAMLTELLPRLQASDAHLLTAQRRRILNRVLNRRTLYTEKQMMGLRLAILKAYEQVGSVEDLPVVERLAKGEGCAKRYPHIREAAQSCLPYLQMRSEQQAARETLLRASSAVSDDGASLLRSAHEAGGTNPQQLLRASNSEPLE